jgi:predicted Zn-dependent peptidase
VVIDEIRRSDDSPHHLVAEALFATAYRTHPYPFADPRLARERRLVRTATRCWRSSGAGTRRTTLLVVACGAFDAEALAERVAASFADAKPAGARRARPVEPPQTRAAHAAAAAAVRAQHARDRLA